MSTFAPPAALAAATARGIAANQGAYGRPVKIGETEGTGIFDAPRFDAATQEGGEKIGFDATLRLVKADWSFTDARDLEGQPVKLRLNGSTWNSFRVASVEDLHQTGEWRLQLLSGV